jgi:hypothetical protein
LRRAIAFLWSYRREIVKIILAPGVTFFEDRHAYYCQGKKLSGVTGLIAEKLRIKMPEEFVGERQAEGVHVHKAVQRWIETGDSGSVHPAAAWAVSCFMGIREGLGSEVLVSDFKRYASSVDVIDAHDDGVLDLYDIKTGVFKRDYCSWQLSIYKYLIEAHTSYKVRKLEVLCAKDKEIYPIFAMPTEKVEKLLYGD